jgi:hypothetical protein
MLENEHQVTWKKVKQNFEVLLMRQYKHDTGHYMPNH